MGGVIVDTFSPPFASARSRVFLFHGPGRPPVETFLCRGQALLTLSCFAQFNVQIILCAPTRSSGRMRT